MQAAHMVANADNGDDGDAGMGGGKGQPDIRDNG